MVVPRFWLAAVGISLVACASGAAAQGAGEVEFSRGVGFAQTAGQVPRTLGKGLSLREGDRLTTSDGASAIIRLDDGTRMTVRPNSEIVLQQYRYRENAPDNSMLMQLVRGGFRAVTGLIAKSSPNAARIQTSTATIGIRGTDFDARICARDCGAESAAISQASRPIAVQASARVVSSQGTVSAVDPAGQRRRLVNGGSVYPGDLVETSGATQAVLAFRDDTRVTLGSTTRFRVDNFVYDTQNASEGRFLASVLRGSIRALTGLIAKANNRNVGFNTATATIGIRGTGVDIQCTSRNDNDYCEDLTLWTWLGSIAVNRQGDTALEVLQEGQGLQMTPTAIRPIASQPAIEGPRPDSVTVPPKLFSGEFVSDNEEGLFVFLRDGHIEIATAGGTLHLGRGELGFAGTDGDTRRLVSVPKFIDFDPVPLPGSRNPLLVSVLAESGVKRGDQCR
ncbi:MAG: FecR domain-containing protein [Pseudomonadota bacterium]